MRHRNARIRRRGHRRGHPGNDLEGNPCLRERLGLLPAPSEDKRVASLEANHFESPARQLDEQEVDLALAHHVISGGLAGENLAAAGRAEFQQLRVHKAIVYNGIGPPEKPRRAKREELRIARTRADDMDAAT